DLESRRLRAQLLDRGVEVASDQRTDVGAVRVQEGDEHGLAPLVGQVERLAGRVLEPERRGGLGRRRDRALERRGLGGDGGTGRLLRRRGAAAAEDGERRDQGERYQRAWAMGQVVGVRGGVNARFIVCYP